MTAPNVTAMIADATDGIQIAPNTLYCSLKLKEPNTGIFLIMRNPWICPVSTPIAIWVVVGLSSLLNKDLTAAAIFFMLSII